MRDVDALDATIRIFAPDLDVKAVRVRPAPRRNGARHGDTALTLLGLLRDGPMTSTALIEAVMAQRDMSRADRKLYRVMRSRVMSSLRNQGTQGTLVRTEEDGIGVRRLAD